VNAEPHADTGPAAPITVVIVDDHLLMATTVATALATKPDITVLGVADSCASGLAAVIEHRPDVLLLDQRLPDGLGTDILPAVLAAWPKLKVIVVTGVAGDDVVVAAMNGGAAGIIAKGHRFDVLVKAVRDAAHDETVLAPDVLRRLGPRLALRPVPHAGARARRPGAAGEPAVAVAPWTRPPVVSTPKSPEAHCTVFVCDDQKELRNAIGKVLIGLPDFTLVGEAADGAACLDRLPSVRPDILILDVNMPGGGPRVPRAAKMIDPSLHILVYSGRTDDLLRQEMLSAGADEYVVKTGRLRPLLDALGRAHDHKAQQA
jgi:DNA-binding NarL/FixJ family response regulator